MKKVEHINKHMQKGNLKLLGLVLLVSMFVGLALLNCCHFHQVKIFDRFYRRLLNAKGSRHRFFICGKFRANILDKLKSSEKPSFLMFMFSEPYSQLQNQMIEHSGIIPECGLN